MGQLFHMVREPFPLCVCVWIVCMHEWVCLECVCFIQRRTCSCGSINNYHVCTHICTPQSRCIYFLWTEQNEINSVDQTKLMRLIASCFLYCVVYMCVCVCDWMKFCWSDQTDETDCLMFSLLCGLHNVCVCDWMKFCWSDQTDETDCFMFSFLYCVVYIMCVCVTEQDSLNI